MQVRHIIKGRSELRRRALMANACARGRPIAPLVLSAQERTYLERQVRRHRVAQVRHIIKGRSELRRRALMANACARGRPIAPLVLRDLFGEAGSSSPSCPVAI